MSLKQQIFILLLFCGLNFFINNGYFYPDIMEARNLITAREMASKGNWLNPTMNDYPRLAKPPLPTWINGVIATQIPTTNLAVHRIPGALVGTLMVLSIFFMVRVLTKDPLAPFLSALVGITSYYLILMSRQATWDIYAYAFMTTAICFLVQAWRSSGPQYRYHALSGLFIGLSFMSKGPVAHYGLLLPFLLAWVVFMDRRIFKTEGKGLVITLLVALVISLPWPIYQLLSNTDAILHTVNAETQAWSNRHVKPFYQYWGFWSHTGIWSLFALITLYFPYTKKRIRRPEIYFLIAWTIFIVVLLSIPAEKKERYILPVLVPLSVLIGWYFQSLYELWKLQRLSYFEKNIIRIFGVLVIIATVGIPVVIMLKIPFSLSMALIIFCFGALLLYLINNLLRWQIPGLFWGSVVLMSLLSLLIIPKIYVIQNDNPKYQSLKALQKESFYNLNFYAEHINPKQIFDLGKPVDTLHVDNDLVIPPTDPEFVILSENKYSKDNFQREISRLDLIDSLFYDPESERKWFYVYHVRR